MKIKKIQNYYPLMRGLVCAFLLAIPTIAVSAEVPLFEVDASWPHLPVKWKLGDASSVAIDAQDHIWVLHRPRTLPEAELKTAAPPVLEFDSEGNYLKGWGGAGEGFEWPEREHGITVDYKGYVWIGGNYCPARVTPGLKSVADDQLLKFTQDGKFVLQVGHSNQSKGNADGSNFQQPADAFVFRKTNELFVADGYGNRRVIVVDANTGQFKRMWGAFGNKPVDEDNCPPVMLSKVPDGPGPDQFHIVHAVRVSRDGIVYVADRENRRVQTFTLEGKFLKQLIHQSGPFARDMTLSTDPKERFVYVGAGTHIVVADRKTLEVIGKIEGPGMLGSGHMMAADSKGNLYIAANGRGVQKLKFKGLAPATH